MKTKLLGLVALVSLLGLSATALADTVTPYVLSATAYIDSDATGQIQAAAGPSGSVTVGNISISGTATGAVQPSPNAQVGASVDFVGGVATASVSLQYYFDILPIPGTTTNGLIGITISGLGGVSAGIAGDANSAAVYFLTDTTVGSGFLNGVCSTPPCGALPTGTNFSFAAPEMVTAGAQSELSLDLSVTANTSYNTKTGPGSDSESGYIDPIITFTNPADAALYSIQFSNGVGNSPAATPLPPSLLLFVGGLGVIGLLGRRRKRKDAAALAAA